MIRFLARTLGRLRRDERGNVFILFGACAIPLMLIMGGAVDFSRYTRYKHELSNGVDAATLALARQRPNATETEGRDFISRYVQSLGIPDARFAINSYSVAKLSNGFRVSVNATMQTMFLPLGRFTRGASGGLTSMGMDIVSEVVSSTNRLELALVLDVTGSMNCGEAIVGQCLSEWQNPAPTSRIVALRSAANSLLDVLMPTGFNPDLIKIGIVPFEGTVNVGATYAANPPSWVDWNYAGAAYWTGRSFDKIRFSPPSLCTSGADCVFVGHRALYEQLNAAYPEVRWAGCVEMRNDPHDILDTTPTAGNADTLFVPFFWPDEPDSFQTKFTLTPDTRLNANYTTSSLTRNSMLWEYSTYYDNNYLADRIAMPWNPTPSWDGLPRSRPKAAEQYTLKYQYVSPSNKAVFHSDMLVPSTTVPYKYGPNRGCPQGSIPLTSDKSTLSSRVTGLIAYPAMGTYIPVGLVWGWHMLTPTEPMSQGVASNNPNYSQTTKAIVLFTDGDNSGGCGYSAYRCRLGATDALTTAALNTKTAALCTNIKNWDPNRRIRVYTITFGTVSEGARTLMSNCATDDNGSRLYYHAPSTSDIGTIFRQIAEDLADIHLSR